MNMNNKMKVLLVSPFSTTQTGGIGTWSKTVLDYSKEKKDICLVFLNTATCLPKRQAMGSIITHYIIGGIDSIRILVALFWKMLICQPDVVHYTSSAASALYKDLVAIWIVKSLFRRKFIIHWHFGRIPQIFEEKGNEYKRFVTVCNNVDISISIDERSFNTLKHNGFNVINVPNPIPFTLQDEAKKLSDFDIHKNRIPGTILYVGHILKNKGVYELVKACSECEMVNQLVLIGPFFDECTKDDLIDIASKRDGGNWLELAGEKKREEVWDYYKRCSVFCLPSYSEGFPYVIMEAMAFGCPIVATNVGAIPEMLNDGCGVIIDAKNTYSLKEAISILLTEENYALDIGLKAHKKVLSKYTIEKVYSMYLSIFKKV